MHLKISSAKWRPFSRGRRFNWGPFYQHYLTHWGRVTHICVSNLTTIGSVNGLSPGRRQAITWTNAEILLIGPFGTNLSEILIEIPTFSSNKTRLKIPSAKWRPFCLGRNVLSEIRTWIRNHIHSCMGDIHTIPCFIWKYQNELIKIEWFERCKIRKTCLWNMIDVGNSRISATPYNASQIILRTQHIIQRTLLYTTQAEYTWQAFICSKLLDKSVHIW